ncbi:MAG: hypothetical protein K0Q48_3321 [Bacillota bacterium]|nr:hypothetical protein [Bacillota bacterium]
MPSASTTLRISRDRKELIAKYATASVSLYGVISVSEFVDVFNHYEETKTTAEETALALRRLAKTDDVEYSMSGDIISGPEFQPAFDDYADNIGVIRENQKGKPHYLPAKDELLRYVDFAYREPEKPYADLKAYILKNKLITRGEGLNGVDGDLVDLHEMAQFGVHIKDYWDYLTKAGYRFKGLDDVNAFTRVLMNVHNNTRMYDNNGFTPQEISEKFGPSKQIAFIKEPVNPLMASPVGRNEPCPCGSGLKYKKCCGK